MSGVLDSVLWMCLTRCMQRASDEPTCSAMHHWFCAALKNGEGAVGTCAHPLGDLEQSKRRFPRGHSEQWQYARLRQMPTNSWRSYQVQSSGRITAARDTLSKDYNYFPTTCYTVDILSRR